MIIENIMGSQSEKLDLKDFEIDYVQIEWYEVSKKILHKISQKGIDVGIRLDRNEPLRHGDILCIEGSKALVVEIPKCDCIVLKPETAIMMGKACYEIGNRHAPLFYQENELLMPFDEPLLLALQKCGFEAYKKSEKLISPLGGELVHGHSHEHSNRHIHEQKAHSH
jgi:urease accessory protein